MQQNQRNKTKSLRSNKTAIAANKVVEAVAAIAVGGKRQRGRGQWRQRVRRQRRVQGRRWQRGSRWFALNWGLSTGYHLLGGCSTEGCNP